MNETIETKFLILSSDEINRRKTAAGDQRILKFYISNGGDSLPGSSEYGITNNYSLVPEDWQKKYITSSLTKLSDSMNLGFDLVTDKNDSDFNFYINPVPEEDSLSSYYENNSISGDISVSHQTGFTGTEYQGVIVSNLIHTETTKKIQKIYFLHEFGHMLGLEHVTDSTDGDLLNPYYPEGFTYQKGDSFPFEYTVMGWSGNHDENYSFENLWFTDADIRALREIWGSGPHLGLTYLESLKYLASNSDLINAFGLNSNNAKLHYKNYGQDEGRTLTSFNPSQYLNNYSDLESIFGNVETLALEHYIQYGFYEGRNDKQLTDLQVLKYVASNPDLISVFGVNTDEAYSHYLNFGQLEGRSLNTFNSTFYLNKYADLSVAFNNNETLALKHYIQNGFKEGRKDYYVFTNNADLKTAVNLWISSQDTAFEKYGHISKWDVSKIVDFSKLFQNTSNFNEDISNWDVSSGNNFYAMFDFAQSFNQNLSKWDVSSGLTFNGMFYSATSFNQNISNWDVSSSRNFQGMFAGATSFNQNLSNWNMSHTSNYSAMFSGATAMLSNQGVTGTPIPSYFVGPIDTTPPDNPILSTNDSIFNESNPTIKGTTESNSIVKIHNGGILLGSTITSNDGNFSITTDNLSDGSYNLKITSTDEAGNISSPSNINFKINVSLNTNLKILSYIASNSDLISAFGIDTNTALEHYFNSGISEGRSLTSFSATDYLSKYSDLSTAFGNDETLAINHYIQYGYKEGRTDSSDSGSSSSGSSNLDDFEALNYIASNKDLISTFGVDIELAKSHYINYGKSEGRILDDFDEWGYLASNNDLMNAFGSNATKAIKHFISYGKLENRLTNLFNAESYLNNYSDLKSAFGNDIDAAKKHFVEYGFNEGREF